MTRLFPWIVAALALSVIAPALWSGWIGDDAFYSVLDGILGSDRISLWHAMSRAFDLWFFDSGRFYPMLIIEKYLVFALFTDLIAYKLLLVAATLVALELFRRCVGSYTTPNFANLAAIVAAALFAMRGYHDAILSYNAMPQFVAILLLGSFMAFRHVLRGDSGPWSALSIGLYALAALTWEEAYAFALLYVAAGRCRDGSWRNAVRVSIPYLAIAVALGCFSIALRGIAHVPSYSPYGTNFAAEAALRTFAEQLLAALPLSYYLFDPSHIFSRSSFYDFYNNAPLNPLIFIAFLAAAGYALNEAARDAFDARATAIVGILAMLLASAPIAIVVKYQQELRPGLGYLPVFYEELACALVVAAVATLTMRASRSVSRRAAWSAAIAAIAMMTQATNVRIIRENAAPMQTRSSLERELDAGLFDRVPENAFVTTAPRDWIAYDGQGPEGIGTRGLFYLHGRKRVHLVEPNDPRATITLLYGPAPQRWRLVRSNDARDATP